ncbi:hypothetical protein NAEGRDRAFT_78142 [Naegleria gruberi]|uniref:RGS domain-containing protein n=1 Tax=Naegleria gruberi TaxID=5762 RepID=D2V1I0_NAEGR|nr:uncharacterized protein NAEGRDRAFT_78142 [Naegleria gruberi]EFC49167.1 hypothetical protein NAEGRDRAFT_78142 [Naegleria gruberi]|eukprot:XP_002681911.1 hypothetical protein NAEGRDRAFT_78142 [Naegleria gruberi strain NEG-M]
MTLGAEETIDERLDESPPQEEFNSVQMQEIQIQENACKKVVTLMEEHDGHVVVFKRDSSEEEDNDSSTDVDSNIAIDEFEIELPDIRDVTSLTSATPISAKSPVGNPDLPLVSSQSQQPNKKKFKIKCNAFRLITLASLLFNIVAFLALIGLTINTYLSSNNTSVEILIARGDTNYYNTVLWDTAKLAVLTNDSSTTSRYTTNAKNFRNSLKNILNGLPSGFQWKILDGTNATSKAPMFPYYDRLFNLTTAKKWTEARQLYFSTDYQSTLTQWNIDYQQFHESITKVGQGLDDYVFASSIANLVIIGISLAIVVPVIVFVFVLMVRKDGMAKSSLQSLNSEMILETMRNEQMREDFKNHCMASNMYEYYSILEKMVIYSEICGQIAELTKHGKASEQVQLLEKTKIEIAFEIIADVQESNSSVLDENTRNYISSTVDEVNNSLNEREDLEQNNLSPTLFHDLEKEIQDQLLYVHYVFKHQNTKVINTV